MKKRISIILLIMALLLTSTACTAGQPAETGPVSLTDQSGRSITLEKTAETIVSCYYVSSYAVMALGLSGKAIGEALNTLLEQVLDEALPNERQALLTYVEELQ